MKANNTITQTFLEILAIYFRELWAYPSTHDHTKLKPHDLTIASMNVSLHAKNQYDNLNLSGDTNDLLFPNTMGMPRHS